MFCLAGSLRSVFGFRRLPREVRTALPVEPGERVISHAPAAGGGHVVATTVALHLPGGTRLPWHLVDRASWDEAGAEVTMTDGSVHMVRLPEPGTLPEVIRERVTATILASRHVPLDSRGGVRLVARRIPGHDTARWDFVFDPDLDPTDPGLRMLAELALEDVRQSLGI